VSSEHERRSRSFGAVARAYDTYRPGVPVEARSLYGELAGRDVVELGAGTGLITRFLRDQGAHVIAVDPDEAMRAVLVERSPEVTVIDALAHDLPLAAASADLVVASSAWHWFSQPETTLEVARILRDNGRLLIAGNGFDTMVTWTNEIGDLRRHGTDLTDRNFVASVPTQGPFSLVRETTVHYEWLRTPHEVVGLFNTYSATLILAPEERERKSDEVRQLLAPHVRDGQVALAMATTVMEFCRDSRTNTEVDY
jgi:SAM-dependent methyltransferase